MFLFLLLLQIRGLALTAAEGLCTRCVADNTASCVLTETSPGYDCTCLDGYAGTRCQYDLCADKCNDDGTATCTKSPGDATCNCNDGWTGEGCSIDLCTKVRTLSFGRNSTYCFPPWDNLISIYAQSLFFESKHKCTKLSTLVL